MQKKNQTKLLNENIDSCKIIDPCDGKLSLRNPISTPNIKEKKNKKNIESLRFSFPVIFFKCIPFLEDNGEVRDSQGSH